MRAPILLTTCGVSLLSLLSYSQSPQSLPGCDAAREVRRAMNENLAPGRQMKFAVWMATLNSVVENLSAKYPREIVPTRYLIDYLRWTDPDQLSDIQSRLTKQVQLNPEDPLTLDLAARALWHKDTDSSILMLQKATQIAPDWPWPYADLAEIYAGGRHENKAKAAANLEAFLKSCPAGMDATLPSALVLERLGDTVLSAKVAAGLRVRLSNESDLMVLRSYETLWGLEFRTRPPNEHDALRKQVAADVARLRRINPDPDVRWLYLLLVGEKESGASPAAVEASEDRLLSKFPHSQEAFEITSERWRKSHKQPSDQSDSTAWGRYNREYEDVIRQWLREYPDVLFLPDLWFSVIQDDENIPLEKRLSALEQLTRNIDDYEPPHERWRSSLQTAEFLIRHRLELDRALEALRTAQQQCEKESARNEADDDLSDEMKSFLMTVCNRKYITGLTLKAAKLAGKPDQAEAWKMTVEGTVPPDVKEWSQYWTNRARLAELEGRKADALAFYASAIQTRTTTPVPFHGRLDDELTDDALALWRDLGGSDSGWKVWMKTDARGHAEIEGRWEKPKKALPSFELSDLSGKTWRLKDLAGKAVLITVWTTWCGPCRAELPHVQRLYEQLKGRPNVQVLTFNADDEFGLVAPYVRENNYTFPVLSAANLLHGMFEVLGVPQSWIVDSNGRWLETQFGYGEADNWEGVVLQKLESAKEPK